MNSRRARGASEAPKGLPDPAAAPEDRWARVEALRAAKRRTERRRSATFFGILLIGSAIACGKPAYAWVQDKVNDPLRRQLSSFGVALPEAGCGKIASDPAEPPQRHVKVGTRVAYTTVPPSSGRHYEQPVPFSARPFFTPKDNPPVENLVHNLEHGYTVLWYDPELAGADIDEISDLTDRLRNEARYQQFIATAWDPAYGPFPPGTRIALSHWSGPGPDGAAFGRRLLCERLSGQGVREFMERYPATDAPERNLR